MEIYVEQMEAITELLRALNAWEDKYGSELLIDSPLTVRYAQAGDDEQPYGTLVDEIGGVWAFRPYDRLRDVKAGAELHAAEVSDQ